MEEFIAKSGNFGVIINRIPLNNVEIDQLFKAEKIKAQTKKLNYLRAVLNLGRIHNIEFESEEQKQAINDYISSEVKKQRDKASDKWRKAKIRVR
ncbi:MAG: hypothetical protein PHG06_00670 [Parabacteroides sp.]|nr:hypothetical protein [Parabacteroides sp.]